MARPVITLTTDFGTQDWFVAVVHGVLYGICPDAHIVDLTHEIPPGHIARAAFVLEAAAPDFPPGSVHLAVVDPGVGTARRALAVSARGQLFVGPDNGLLSWALRDPAARAHTVTEDRWFRHPVSRTFHARDVFAPVAAHVARGIDLAQLGPRIEDAIRLPHLAPVASAAGLEGCIMYLDRFGNALTNIEAVDLERAFPGAPDDSLEVRVLRATVRGLSRAYAEHPLGTVVAILGSSGRLEIAQVGGDCAARFGIGEGDRVLVRPVRSGTPEEPA